MLKFKTNKKTGSVQTKKLVLFKQKNWFRSNKMSVNVSKTKYIVFRPCKGHYNYSNINPDEEGVLYNSKEIGEPEDPYKIFKLGRIHNEPRD